VLFHDALTPVAIAQKLYPNDPRAQEAALVHVQLDMLCSSNPMFKQQLQWFAEQDAKERKRLRKRNAKKKSVKPRNKRGSPDELERFNEFLEKLAEIRRLAKLISS